MAIKNHVILGGNLTRDPETRFTNDKTPVAEFGLAVSRPAPKGQDNGTDFFTVVAFGKLAELVAERKRKGDAVVVEGRIDYSSWEVTHLSGVPDGSRRNQVRVKADDVQFVDTIGNGVNIAVLIGNLSGLAPTPLKKLNGARLSVPSGARVETQAMGRGTMNPVISL